jgi:hypothetical protein
MLINELPTKRSTPYKHKKTAWARMKFAIRSKLIRYRLGETIIFKLWRPIKFLLWKIKWGIEAFLRRRGELATDIDVDRVYRISPQKIVFTALREFNLRNFKGQILGGDWDQLEKRFDTLDLYLAIKQVCQEGKDWTDTVFYRRILADLKDGHIHYGCHNESDLIKHCKRIEELYYIIQQNGYKTQQELLREGKVLDRMAAEEEVAVSVGRFGDLLFSDGAHRLAIAKLLAVHEIPVRIAVRHADWIKFRNELLSYGRHDASSKSKKPYQPVTHPDLTDLPATHKSDYRFQLISDNLSARSGRLLDIGANLGYFCHRFEELGFDCYAVENHPSTAYFLQRLARAENRNFKVITESVFDAQEVRNTYFDVVLALNIFHHFIKTRSGYEKLSALLNYLHMGELFFEPHSVDETQMYGAYHNYSPEEFVDFIMIHSRMKNADFIGVMDDGRPMYKIY